MSYVLCAVCSFLLFVVAHPMLFVGIMTMMMHDDDVDV